MKEIQLSQGKVAMVSDEDFERVSKIKWCAMRTSRLIYATCAKGKKREHALLHRFILDVKKGQIIDHIDSNGLNNQRENLRLCTQAENLCNKRVKINKKSKYLGVFYDKRSNKWQAQIRKNYKLIWLGRHKTEAAAALAYNTAAIIHHGAFANLNTIE